MGKIVRKLRPLMTVMDLTGDQRNSSAKRLPHQEPQIAKLPPVPNSGRRPCQPTRLRVSQQEGVSQPTGRRESANRKARVSQQEGVSQPTGRRESANRKA